MASNDEWWRHDKRSSSSSHQVSSGSSQQQPSPYSNSYTTASSGQEHYSLSGETVAPWRKNDATSHLNAMRSKRDSRIREGSAARSGAVRASNGAPRRDSAGRRVSSHVPRTQYSQFKETNRNVPQFKDSAASRGGWDIPSLNSKSNTGTSANIFGSRRLGNIDTKQLALIVAGLLALILVVVILRGIVGCVSSVIAPAPEPETVEAATSEDASSAQNTSETKDAETGITTGTTTSGVSYKVLDAGRTTASGMGRVSFSAAGDNLMNENLLELADSWAGTSGDGQYDFSPFYEDVSGYIKNWIDVSFINQETTLGGTDNFNYAGYPSYNTPDSLADAVAKAGWRIVNTNSNHTYDTWVSSIEHAQQVWNSKTSLLTVGSYTSEEDRSTIRVVECNGIRIATLSYCYGQNGYEQSDLPNDYYAVPYDEARMKAEVAHAREVADAVVVYMHEGTEYTNEPNETQVQIAQACADSGVDVVLGSHSHVIQPVEWIERSDGSGKMLCVYGLGDFVAGYPTYPDTIMSGMITFDFVRASEAATGDAETADGAQDDTATSEDAATTGSAGTSSDNVGPGGIVVENVVWHPLIEHMENGTDKVRFVSGYSDEEARKNELLSSLDDPYNWIIDKTKEVIGDKITIDM